MNHPSFVFFGTPDVAEDTLDLLYQSGLVPKLIVTAPNRPVGRHFTLTPPPVKIWADAHDIPTLQPEKITPEIIAALPHVDLFIVVAYGKILPQQLIDAPTIATLNIHYSLLPKWRGASPVEAALLHGESETGVSIQKMVFKLDAGPILGERRIPIDINDTTQTLRKKLIPLGAELLVQLITQDTASFKQTIAAATLQDESQTTHCGKIKKEDACITLSDSPIMLWNKYRAYHGWPTIYFINQHGKRVKIIQATYTKKGTLESFTPITVIPEGHKEMSYEHYLKNHA
jgi:methionyl-tRNA formyltransferase